MCVFTKSANCPPSSRRVPLDYIHMCATNISRVVLACPYCPSKVYWNTKGWKSHMETKHKDVPHYGHKLAGETPATVKRIIQEMAPSKESVPPQKEVEEEVPPTEDSSSDSGASSHTSESSTAHPEHARS